MDAIAPTTAAELDVFRLVPLEGVTPSPETTSTPIVEPKSVADRALDELISLAIDLVTDERIESQRLLELFLTTDEPQS